MQKLDLDKATRDHLSRHLAQRLKDSFDIEMDPFDALDLLDFLSGSMGVHYYNKGLADAQTVIRDRAEQLIEAVDGLSRTPPR